MSDLEAEGQGQTASDVQQETQRMEDEDTKHANQEAEDWDLFEKLTPGTADDSKDKEPTRSRFCEVWNLFYKESLVQWHEMQGEKIVPKCFWCPDTSW